MNVVQPNDLSLDYFNLDSTDEKIKINQVYTISELQQENVNPPIVFIKDSNISSFYLLDLNDTTSVSDNDLIILNSNNKRYKKVKGFSFQIKENQGNPIKVNTESIITLLSNSGIDIDVANNLDITISNKISNIANNKLKIESDGGLYAEGFYGVKNIGYNPITGELYITYSDNSVQPLMITSVSNPTNFNVTGSLGNFVVDYLNPILNFRGVGIIPIADSTTRSIYMQVIPITATYKNLMQGNVLNTQTLLQSDEFQIISVYRNGIILNEIEDYTISYVNNVLILTFTESFGSSNGAVNTGETITITGIPSK